MPDVERTQRARACVACARRKTKCDHNSPCSSCVAANVQCHYVHKQPEKKQRVLLSSRYEDSLASINRQLEALSDTLRSLVDKGEVSSRRKPSDDHSGYDSTATTVRAIPDLSYDKERTGVTDHHDYDGESSFYSQSKRIVDNLTQTLSSAPGNATDGQAAAISVARTLIQDPKAIDSSALEEDLSQSTSCAFSQYPELAGLDLPPMDSVLRLLSFAKTSPQSYFINIPHTDEEEFATLCQKIYFPTRPFTLFTWINMNCGLFLLFRDLEKSRYDQLNLTRSQVSRNVAICSNNIDRAVASIPLCANSCLAAVDALICAAIVSMDQAKGRLAWKLVSAAARMCIDLGYQHLPPGYGDRQRSHKRKLFWYVYSMDRSLAFNFGRSPTIQARDVTTERPVSSEDFTSKWGCTFLKYIDLAQTQFEIYEQLLSARAQQEPLSTRVDKVHEFAAKLLHIKDSLTLPPSQEEPILKNTIYEAVRSMDIGFSSMLTLLYRNLPPDDPIDTHQTTSGSCHPLRFNSLCVEAGRTTLNALVSRWDAVLNEQDEDAAKTFLNWNFLFMPFMPYIAVLGNQIATGSREDLTLLRNVVNIVGIAAKDSGTLDRMYKAFAQLFRIAELWTSTSESRDRGQSQGPHTQPGAGFDRNSRVAVGGKQLSSDETEVDVQMTAPTATDFLAESWQDMDGSHQDWDMMFSEFDLGLGAENAREMMPWFEQNMNWF